MSPRARLLLGAMTGLAAAVVVLAAANATWRTVTGEPVVVDVGNEDLVIDRPREVKGTTQDGSLALFAITGAAAALVAPMVSFKPRMGASALLGASGLMVAAGAAITRRVAAVPAEWLADDAVRYSASPPTTAPLVAIAGGLVMTAAAAWLLTAARRAPRLSMPEGPPDKAASDEGAWE